MTTAKAPTAGEPLTARENEVFFLLAKGLTNKEIGDALHLSIHTISDHMKSLFLKLDVTRRAEAAVIAAKRGIV